MALRTAFALSTALLLGPGVPAASARSCSAARQMQANRGLATARARYHREDRGAAAKVQLMRIASDAQVLSALSAGSYQSAQRRLDQLLIGHVVRIRVVRNGRVVADANPRSFAVGGARAELRYRGRDLGAIEVTIQDVVGFIKLVHKYGHVNVVVRGAFGEARSSLSTVPAGLPRGGCVTTAGRAFAVRSFAALGFAGERLTVWVLA